jgi:ABC-type sugar transport system permease subunit
MEPEPVSENPAPARPGSGGEIIAKVIGGLLAVPALVLAVLTLLVPTVEIVGTSMRAERLIGRGEGEDVGFGNYARVLDDPTWWDSVWFALSLVVVPILVAVVVAPLLAAAAAWAGGWARLTTRVTLSFALVVFSPVALAIAWQRTFRDDPGLLAEPDVAAWTMRTVVAMMSFGVVCAVGVLIFLPVFRARETRRPIWPALFATAGVTTLALLAIGLQHFTVPYIMTNFGPTNRTMTPVGLIFRQAFSRADLGVGAAVSAVLLAILALLGVGAVLIVILTRLRVSLLPFRRQRPPAEPAAPAGINPGAIVVAVLALVAVLVAVVLNGRPWFDALSGSAPDAPPDTADRTWSSAAVGAVVSVGVAYLAAVGISGLRPLGRFSEWLLLPFAPWLFVGVAPLSIAVFKSAAEEGQLDTESVLRPPVLVSVASLLILAMLCHGQSHRWRHQVAAGASTGGAFVRTVLLPTLPLAGFLFVVTLLLNAQDLLWPLLVAAEPEHDTTVLTLIQENSTTFGSTDFSVASATPLLAVVLGMLAVVAAQVLHLDRMVAATGKADEPAAHPAWEPTQPVA